MKRLIRPGPITLELPGGHPPVTYDAIDAHPAHKLAYVSDIEWQVQLAAKGISERDNRLMPKSVTTPEAFYKLMAAAALDAIGLPDLLQRLERAERELEIIQEAFGEADAKAKSARHQAITDDAASSESTIASILRGASTGRGPERIRIHDQRTGTLQTHPVQSETVDQRRRLSTVPSPVQRSGGTEPPVPSCQPAKRTARGSRSALAKFLAIARIRVRVIA